MVSNVFFITFFRIYIHMRMRICVFSLSFLFQWSHIYTHTQEQKFDEGRCFGVRRDMVFGTDRTSGGMWFRSNLRPRRKFFTWTNDPHVSSGRDNSEGHGSSASCTDVSRIATAVQEKFILTSSGNLS